MQKRTESGSSLAVFRTCPKRYEFEYERMLTSKHYPSALGLGSFVHGLIEDYRSEGRRASFVAAVGEFKIKYPGEESWEEIQKDMLKATSMFNAWRQYWEGVESTSFGERNLEFLDVEAEWKYELPHGFHVGKRDGRLKNRITGKHYLYELKSAAASGESNYIHRLSLDHQISANIHAIRSASMPVDGVLYDIIFKPMIRQKKDESPAEFAQRFATVMLEEPESYFKRLLVDRMPKTLDEYNTEVDQQFQQLEAGIRYRNTSACMKFGSLCPFFNLCMDPGVPELELEFTKRRDKFPELKDANDRTETPNQEAVSNGSTEAERPGVRAPGSWEDYARGNRSEGGDTPDPFR